MLIRNGTFAGWVVGLTGLSAGATTIVERTFGDLCQRAEVVFCGTVSAIEARQDGPDGAIHTFVTFDDVQWLLGDDGQSTFVLRMLGGTADGESLAVDGMPRFALGRRYVLFVRGNGRSPCPIVGWHQGCFGVQPDNDGAPRVVTYAGNAIVTVANGRVVTDHAAEGRAARVVPMSLDQFLDAARDELDRVAIRRQGAAQP